MAARESAWGKVPDYRVDLNPHAARVRVRFGGETLVDTTRALRVEESRHAPVLYVPREDARMELLERTEHHTFCPFKGEASYFSVRAGDAVAENAVWTYEDPFPEVAGLRDYLACYEDRVELLED